MNRTKGTVINYVCKDLSLALAMMTVPFYSARETISGIENIRMIQKGQILGQTASQSAFLNFVTLMA
ncbi:hypothetical protein [Candidatus Odyssella acanthamoebae]|uniref:hypothetical protein n=1 Tax=Candidatus Odyssella acanthamoebae TaxID=91604 RepID=UPI0012EB3DB5|nr:hypothetical protein [Candidatus Paracaedibacter acanthamoebae]